MTEQPTPQRGRGRPANPIKPTPGELPTMPDWLADDPIAASCWTRTIAALEQLGTLSAVDAEVVTLYAATYSRWQRAAKTIETDGLTFSTPGGQVKRHPAVAVADAAGAALLQIESQLGLTPRARQRLRIGVGGQSDAALTLRRFLADPPAGDTGKARYFSKVPIA